MELLKLPNNHDLYERHKAQARERTRRYREKMRQQKLQGETKPFGQSIATPSQIVQQDLQATFKEERPLPMNDQPPVNFTSSVVEKPSNFDQSENNKIHQDFEFSQVKVEKSSPDDHIVFT